MPEYHDPNADFKLVRLSPGGEILLAYWKTVATNIFCVGHGIWVPRVGFARVPARGTIAFYTPANTIVNTKYLVELEIYNGGTPEPFDIYNAGVQVPNYVLSPLPSSIVNPILALVGSSQYRRKFSVLLSTTHVKLSDLFKAIELNIPTVPYALHWTACRLTQFNNTSRVIGADMRSPRAIELGMQINKSWAAPLQITQNREVFESIGNEDL